MLAIAIIIGIVYLALNYAENIPQSKHPKSKSYRRLSSFKESERKLGERVDLVLR